MPPPPWSLLDLELISGSEDDANRLLSAVNTAWSDPARPVDTMFCRHPDTGRMILSADSEEALSELVFLISRYHSAPVLVGAPIVHYREMISCEAAAEIEAENCRLALRLEHASPLSGFWFKTEVADAPLGQAGWPQLEAAFRDCFGHGFVAGFALTGVTAVITRIEMDSAHIGRPNFERIARTAFAKIMPLAMPVVIEPFMRVHVGTPVDYVGSVKGDLNSRRARDMTVEKDQDGEVVQCLVPLANMFGYANNLRAFTQGRGDWTMEYDSYRVLPRSTNGNDPGFRPAMAMRARA